ncbi:uncharacterized protein LOC143284691 [Babylonia areolata]|uniref:uncharacterized protein LOC143284691 n=1 Tax=Babylonia areolata TaxID=304850 RepID=UPI003FD05FE8
MERHVSFVCAVLVLAASAALSIGGETRDTKGCDPEFKASVERCLGLLQGFPVLAVNKSFVSADWKKTDVICRRELVSSASECVREEYGRCPETWAWRSLCGFQSVQPDLMLRYGQAVCRHREVLQKHWGCLRTQHCSLRTCLDSYDPHLPSVLTVGMLKSPRHDPLCSYQAFTELCYETNLQAGCPRAMHLAHLEVINSSRPFPCSAHDLDRLKRRFFQSEIFTAAAAAAVHDDNNNNDSYHPYYRYSGNAASSAPAAGWSQGAVTAVLIGWLAVVFFWWWCVEAWDWFWRFVMHVIVM